MTLSDLPAVNATLNACSTVLIIAALIAIKNGGRRAHGALMIAALTTSTAFLTCYLIYHFNHPRTDSDYMPGGVRTAYLILLFTHVVLAIVNLPMIIMTVIPAIKKNWAVHRKRARWTWPIWLYVSITGVIVYLWLYVWFPKPV